MDPQLKKIITLVSIFLVLITLSIVLWKIFDKGTLVLNTEPSTTITISHENKSGNQTYFTTDLTTNNSQLIYKLSPGDYQLLLTAPSHLDYTTNFTIKRWQKTNLSVQLARINFSHKLLLPTYSNDHQFVFGIDNNTQSPTFKQLIKIHLIENQITPLIADTIYLNDFAYLSPSPDGRQIILTATPMYQKPLPVRADIREQLINNPLVKNLSDNLFYQPDIVRAEPTTWTINLANREITVLDKSISNPQWLDDEHLIYYYGQNIFPTPETIDQPIISNISSSNSQGQNHQVVFDLSNYQLFEPKLNLSFDKKILYLHQSGHNNNLFTNSNLFQLNLETKVLKKITDSGRNIDILPSPFDQQSLTNLIQAETNNSYLQIISSDQKITDLNLATSTVKTSWLDNQNLLLSLPITPNNYFQKSTSNEKFYTYNTSEQKLQPIFPLPYEFSDISQPAKIGEYLYFVSGENFYSLFYPQNN